MGNLIAALICLLLIVATKFFLPGSFYTFGAILLILAAVFGLRAILRLRNA